MKILMISGDRTLAAGKKGAFWQTLSGLRQHAERIDVVCPKAYGGEAQAFENVWIHPSPWPLILQPLWIALCGKRLVRTHEHTVMTVHEYPPFLNGIGAWFVKRVTKIPTCAEVHHLVGEPVPADWKESVLRQFNRFLPFVTRYSDRIRVVNSSVKTHLMERGIPAEKIVVVPSLYLNLQALYPAEEVGPYDLIFVGRLVPNKGLITVIKALASLPEAVLLVVGEGPERERAEALAKKLGLTGRITFAGWLPGIDDIAAALRSAKIFVMNSTSEGGPRVLLEAMACGLPVVTTPVGIAPDVIREGVNGHFHDGSVMTLVSVLQALLADPITARLLGKSGRSDAERFEFSVGIKVYADFLQSLSR